MIIAVDFDGTCVTHAFPKVGKDIGAAEILRQLTEKKHQLILYTMRDRDTLKDAINWFNKNNISLYRINDNPLQHSWTSSPKVYTSVYIDDAAIGTLLVTDYSKSSRPFVD